MLEFLEYCWLRLEDTVSYALMDWKNSILAYAPSDTIEPEEDTECTLIDEEEILARISKAPDVYKEFLKFQDGAAGAHKKYRRYWLHKLAQDKDDGNDICWAQTLLETIIAEAGGQDTDWAQELLQEIEAA